MSIIIVIERDYRISDPDMRDRYVGSVCHTFEEARKLVYAHRCCDCDISVCYVNNGTDYAVSNAETGELVCEYFVRLIGHD